MWKCAQCNEPNQDYADTCSGCGAGKGVAPLSKQPNPSPDSGKQPDQTKWVCPKCGLIIEGNFCWKCGAVKEGDIPQQSSDNKVDKEIPKSEKPILKHNDTKKCPYCAEEIRYEAIKCRYCSSDLTIKPAEDILSSTIPTSSKTQKNTLSVLVIVGVVILLVVVGFIFQPMLLSGIASIIILGGTVLGFLMLIFGFIKFLWRHS